MSGLLVGLMRSDSAHDRADVLDVHWPAAVDVHTVSRWKPMARYRSRSEQRTPYAVGDPGSQSTSSEHMFES
jgi:hypothetical protein